MFEIYSIVFLHIAHNGVYEQLYYMARENSLCSHDIIRNYQSDF